MRAFLLTYVLLLAGIMAGFAQGPAMPMISLSDTRLELGKLEQGQSVSRTITVRNRGTAELKITKIRSSCSSCVAGMVGSSIIPPGQSGKLTVTFQTKGLEGAQSKTVYIHSNDPKNAFVKVTVTCTVAPGIGPRLTSGAEAIDFGLVPLRRSAVRAVTLTNTGKSPLTIKSVSVSAGCSVLSQPREAIAPAATGTIKIALAARRVKGPIQGFVTIQSTDPIAPVQTLGIGGYAADTAAAAASVRGILIRPAGAGVRIPGNPLRYQRSYDITNGLPVPVTVTLPGKSKPTVLASGETTAISISMPDGKDAAVPIILALPALLPAPAQ
jgi:uncharacterized protein DUF1573